MQNLPLKIRFRSSFSFLQWGSLLLLMGMVCSCVSSSMPSPPKAQKGILDVTQWSFEKEGIVKLDGQWAFYWNQLLEPKNFQQDSETSPPVWMKQPSTWNNSKLENPYDTYGYATYKLEIKTAPLDGVYALKVPNMGNAYKLWVNGKLLASNGIVGTSRETMTPQWLPQVVPFQMKGKTIQLVIQVSNFVYKRGGFWHSLIIGTHQQIQEFRERTLFLEQFLFGSLLIMGFYHFGLYALRPKDRSPLYFGLYSLLFAIRILSTGEKLLVYYYHISWELNLMIEYLTFYLSVPIFTLFFQSLYPQEFSKTYVRILLVLGGIFSLIVLFTSSQVYPHTVGVYQLIALVSAVYGTYVLGLTVHRKREGSLLFLFGWFFLFATLINDILYQQMMIDTGNFAPIGVFIFIFFQSVVLSQRFSKAFVTAEELSNKLEQKVIQRTEELNQSLATKEKINNDLMETTQELENSRLQLEHQFSALQASHNKLESLNNTKNQLLEKMNSLHEDHFPSLQENLEAFLKDSSSREPIRQALREMHVVNETLRPFHSLYQEKQAIENKRVLLAETDRKAQMVAKMALGGTGVELDIISTLEEGQKLLEEKTYDIICSNMALIELTKYASDLSPEIQTVFMTSDDISVYLPVLRKYPFLSNIVTRNDEDKIFTLKNISTTIRKLTTHDLFGLEKYLNWGVEVQQAPIQNSHQRSDLVDSMETYFRQLGIRKSVINKCGIVVEELLMNAIYDAPIDAEGNSLYNHLSRTIEVELKPQEQGIFRYACDGLLVAVSVEDPFGGFHRDTILNYLESCYQGQGGTLQKNKGGAGRGLYQIIEIADLVIFNVKHQVRTEVIVIFNIGPDKPKHSGTTSFHYFFG